MKGDINEASLPELYQKTESQSKLLWEGPLEVFNPIGCSKDGQLQSWMRLPKDILDESTTWYTALQNPRIKGLFLLAEYPVHLPLLWKD